MSLYARILLAKFDRKDRESTLLSVGNMQGMGFECCPNFEENGLIKLKVPLVRLEASVTAIGDKCMREIFRAGGISAIPVLDMRSMK